MEQKEEEADEYDDDDKHLCLAALGAMSVILLCPMVYQNIKAAASHSNPKRTIILYQKLASLYVILLPTTK